MTRDTPGRASLARLVQCGIWLGMVLLALMAFLVVLQVAARNFLDLGLPWADELARFSCIGLVFLSVPCLAGRQVLVAVTMLPDMSPKGVRKAMTLIADLATLAFAALMLWSFAEFLPRAGKFLTPAMQVPNWIYYSLALTGSLFLAAVALTRVVSALRGRLPGAAYHDNRDETGLPI
ncbi:MAG: TRAP transporter small permease [Salipiger thiooxidans]|uniref:TRAP transporter small permease n=1 Tax=Salipiger thiooxidans TaxID=282683 RepID=UPI001CFB7114|nr:TRAP transporter small permease subunit [Salipiger thiooxidans]